MMSFINWAIAPKSRIMKLDSKMNKLAVEMELLLQSNNTVRSELRRNGGHKGKVNNKVLLWLDHVGRIETQYTKICHSYISLLKLVKFIQIRSSSVVIVFASNIIFDEYSSSGVLPNLRLALVDKIKDKIMEYLDDPMTTAIGFCGGEGWFKCEITREITDELADSSHKIFRVQLFEKTSLRNLQNHITTQLNVQMPEVTMCLFIFDDVQSLNHDLCFTSSRWSVFKINKQIVNLINEVRALVKSHSSLQLLYDEYRADKALGTFTNEVRDLEESFSSWESLYDDDDGGTDRVPGQVTTPHTLTGKSAKEVPSIMWEYLLDPEIGTIQLYGVGGVGKTTIIKNICNELASTNIFDMIIWVSMSRTIMNDENYMRFQDEIAMQLGIKLFSEKLWERASRISEKLKIVGKCLFILDDVCETVSLSPIGIPSPGKATGCKLVLTTRSADVCMKMAVDKKINLAPLSDKEAWDLFVSNSGDQVLDPEIKSIAKEILYECGGLPITIMTICHVMKDQVNITVWRQALKDIRRRHHSRKYGEGMDHLFDVLLFGYNHLKNDQIRACFLCSAIFPEDHKFDPRELIRYWMAENLIHNEGGIVESIKDGLEILKELKDANMLEIFMEGGIEWLKMHDLFRDLAIVIMRVELEFFVEAGVGLHYFDGTRKKKLSLIRNQIYHLNLRTMNTLQNPCINMSTLLLKDNPLYQISYSFFSSMPNLEVLDMSFSGLKELPPSFSELPKLRVLLLEFCTTLEKLPPLGNLKALRFLSLRGTLIKELPQGIKGLVNLRSLDLSETIKLRHIEAGAISSLSKLEELQLQGSRLCMMESPMVANLFKEISCLKLLGILTVSAVGFGNHLDMVLHLQQHNLKTFSVSAYGSALDYMDDE